MSLFRVIPVNKLKQAFGILPKSTKKKLVITGISQVLVSTLDLVALFLIASLGTLAITGIQSLPSNSNGNFVSNLLGLSDLSFQRQVAILGITTAIALLVKTFLTALLNYRIFKFMSRISAQISSELLSRYVSMTYFDIKKRSTQKTLQSLTQGVSSISVGIIGNLVTLFGDLFLVTLMLAGVLAIDPKVGLFSLAFFASVALLASRMTGRTSTRVAETLVQENIRSNNLILSVMRMFREITARGLLGKFSGDIQLARYRIASQEATQAFVPYISKYLMEITLIVGGLLLTAFQFLMEDAANAISGLAVFLVASSRISPAILRLQQAFIQVKSAVASSSLTFQLMSDLKNVPVVSRVTKIIDTKHIGFTPEIVFDSVSFSYPSSEKIFESLTLKVVPSEMVSIVGPSGSGKTSFADLILGQLHPDSGSVTVSGLPPRKAQNLFPGAIAYVPQEIYLFEGTILENILLGIEKSSIELNEIWATLRAVELANWVGGLENGLDSNIAEFGVNVSGGQRQRLGLARALLTKPKLLILDEATSALDEQTERDVAKTIQNLQGGTTIISIAHRPAMIDISSRVIRIDNSRFKQIK